ncbi:MAG TPA: hypothetical protein VFB62_15940, partial [Polyangiaceae bacterium]|nr:hypothetical protein [Polyangiaceae bacterium]
MDRAFAAAMRAAEEAPDSVDAWEHLRELADKLQRPDDVAELYRTVLERRLARDVFARVAERAVQFQEEWFGDAPDKISALLMRIIELDPTVDWAFERLSLMLTSSEQWEELLGVYDRTLAHIQDRERRRRLLHDAAQAAKDFAGQPERAAGYMQQLLGIEPHNAGLVTQLERLLEKSERWSDLINLWDSRVDQLNPEERRETYLRIAACWLDKLGDAQRALDVVRKLVTDHPGLAPACELAERILGREKAELSTRRQALSLLRKNYLVADRPDDVIRVLEQALEFVEQDERRPLYREAATRLAIVGRDVEAIEHYRKLLLGDPTDADARKQMRQLAKRSGREDLHARALVDAAEAAGDGSLKTATLAEAAHLHRTALDDASGAIELYTRVLESPETEPSVALSAAHSLNELYAAADRASERLKVLEKLASLERSSAVRRHALGEAARLAEQLGEPDRALKDWKPVLDQDEHDQEALAAVAALLERNGRWEELIEALRRRSSAPLLPQQKRADLVRIAEVQEHELDQPEEAITTWLTIREELGEDDQVLTALDGLMSRTGRHRELAELLGEAAGRAHMRAASLLVRLADIHRVELTSYEDALRWYSRAAAIDPTSTGARSGLQALIDDRRHAGEAAEALARVYEQTGEWRASLDLLEPRLKAAAKGASQARLLREAAHLHLDRGEDAEAALGCLCRALPLEPDNLATESQLMQLAQHTGRWAEAAKALGKAAESVGDALSRAAQLRKAEAAIHETWLDRADAALEAYRAAADTLAGDAEAFEAIARCGARARQWDVASSAAIRSFGLRDRISRPVLSSLEAGVKGEEDWRALASSLAAALAAKPLRPELAVQIEMTIALWFRDRAEDPDAAEQAASRAVEHVPSRLDALELLAGLQRRSPGPPLITTLLRLNRVLEQSLDPLYEAAQLAADSKHDVAKTRNILEQLYRKSAGMWVRNEGASGKHPPSEVAQWALDRLIDHHVTA